MPLREYLEKHKMTQTAFAKKIGISREYMSRIMNGTKPGPHLRAHIELVTGGAVKRDWEE